MANLALVQVSLALLTKVSADTVSIYLTQCSLQEMFLRTIYPSSLFPLPIEDDYLKQAFPILVDILFIFLHHKYKLQLYKMECLFLFPPLYQHS